jgi:hypothetical protein
MVRLLFYNLFGLMWVGFGAHAVFTSDNSMDATLFIILGGICFVLADLIEVRMELKRIVRDD